MNEMKRRGIYLILLSLLLVAMPSYGLFTCLPAALKGETFPWDMAIFISYGLISGLIVLMIGIIVVKGGQPKRPLLYASAILPLGMAGSAIYFALKILRGFKAHASLCLRDRPFGKFYLL